MTESELIQGRRRIGEISAEVTAIVDHLKESNIGDRVSYNELSALCGRDILKNRHVWQSASNILIRDHGIVFGNLRGHGYQRLDDVAVSDGADSTIKGVRRKVRREVRKQGVVDQAKLNPEQTLRHGTRLAQLGLIGELARPRLTERVNAGLLPKIDPVRTLETFLRPRGAGK